MVYIYYLCRENGVPFYVGKTKNKSQRKSKHRSDRGIEISINFIDEVPENEWKFWEECYISLFKTWGFKLENQNKAGGGPSKHSEETKQKMRKPRPGSGAKISKTLKERNHKQYYTLEVRDKISKANQTEKSFSDSHKENMQLAKLKDAKKVFQYDLKGNFIKEWESKGLAAKWIKEQTGKTSNITSQIKDCILGRQKSAFNFIWKYEKI